MTRRCEFNQEKLILQAMNFTSIFDSSKFPITLIWAACSSRNCHLSTYPYRIFLLPRLFLIKYSSLSMTLLKTIFRKEKKRVYLKPWWRHVKLMVIWYCWIRNGDYLVDYGKRKSWCMYIFASVCITVM